MGLVSRAVLGFLRKSLTQSFGGVSRAPAVGSEHWRCQTLLAGAAGSKIPSDCSLFLVACARLPLERGRKLRDVLREKDLLHQFFQHHHYDIGTKFPHAFPNGTGAATEPLLNTLDVSRGSDPQGHSPGMVCGMSVPVSVLGTDQTQILYPKAFGSHPSPLLGHAGGPGQRNVPQELCQEQGGLREEGDHKGSKPGEAPSLVSRLNSIPGPAGGILRDHLHRHPPTGLHRGLRHRLLRPLGSLRVLHQPGLP